MLPKAKELKNEKVEVDTNETKVIPNDVLVFSQIFGGLPLKYRKRPHKKTVIEFSKPLKVFGFTCITCLTTLSFIGLYYEYTSYLARKRLVMSNNRSTISIFVFTIILNLMAMVVIVTSGRKYSKLIKMCRLLEKVDARLQRKPNLPTTRYKVLVIFVVMTIALLCSLLSEVFTTSVIALIYLHKLYFYFTQIAIYLLFTSVAKCLSTRFRCINEKIQQEIVRLNLKLLIKDFSRCVIISGYENTAADRVYILVNSYAQLYEALQLANSFFQEQLFTAVCMSFVRITLSLNGLFSKIWSAHTVVKAGDLLIAGLWPLANTSYLCLLVWPTITLTNEASKTASLVCRLLSKDLNNADLRDQLETFLLQLRHYKVEFSARGFFQMNSSLLPWIASSVTTYLVIMIQLN